MRGAPGALELIGRLGSDPTDSDDVGRKKRYLVASAALGFVPAGLIWGLTYFAYGEPVAGSIPLGYSLFSAINIAAFARTRNLNVFRAGHVRRRGVRADGVSRRT